MSDRFRWLQFFGEGATGPSGAAGGESAAGAGEQTADAGRNKQETPRRNPAPLSLEELGVPSDKAERFRQRIAKRQDAATRSQTPQQPAEAAASEGNKAQPAKTQQELDAADWDAFFSKPAQKARLEQMMAERGRSVTKAKEAVTAQFEKIAPTLRLLGEKYGIKPGEDGSYDLDAINAAATADNSYYENKALELGVSAEVARRLDQADAFEEQRKAQQVKEQRMTMLREHFDRMMQQAAPLKEIFPDFDLEKELQNPDFFNRTAPGPHSMSVADAFYSIHHDEIMQRQAEIIAKKAREDVTASIRSGSVRPRENGSSSTAAVASEPNMRGMSREDRLEYIKKKYPPNR